MEDLDKQALAGYTNSYLSFSLGETKLALRLAQVREIIFYRNVSPVPLMPEFMRGIYNLRGHVMPVIDLAVRLGRPPVQVNKRSSIVICQLEKNAQPLGLLVDTVSDVLVIAPESIEDAPVFGADVRHDFMLGIAPHDDDFIVVLDAERLLLLSELAELTQHLQATTLPHLHAPTSSTTATDAAAPTQQAEESAPAAIPSLGVHHE